MGSMGGRAGSRIADLLLGSCGVVSKRHSNVGRSGGFPSLGSGNDFAVSNAVSHPA